MSSINFVTEFIGTFVFLFIILQSDKFANVQPFVIVAGLLAAILMFGAVSGGHFNPAVTIMMWVKGDSHVSKNSDAIGYIVAQILGGLAAYAGHNYILKNK